MPQITLALSDIPEGVPHKPEDADVILIRAGDSVTALGHLCPHYGLPLAKGVIRDGALICPFHHACFDARTGRQAQPPGHGDLSRFAVTVADGRVTVELPADAVPHAPPAHGGQGLDTRRVVLAGAGAAAEECALRLRESGFEGVIEMIAPGTLPPYDRTMLSKAALAGKKGAADLVLTDAEGLAARDIARIDGRIAKVEPGRVTLADGGTHAFDRLLVAPGGEPIRPDLPGIDLAGIHTLRSVEEAEALSEAAGAAKRVALIGGGFIGMEGALTLAKRGCDVTVVMREDVPLERVLGTRVGRAIMAEHEDAGVRFVAGAEVEGFDGDGAVSAIRLKGGAPVEADLVVLAMGVKPATGAIEGLPLEKDGGVRVAEDLSVPGLDGVFVAGDCAHAPTPFGAARIEHWRVARQHGARVARGIAGGTAGLADIPFFWTALARQYRYLGHAEDWDEILFDGAPEDGPFLARYVKDGQVMAALTAGRDADLAALHLRMAAASGPVPA
ncbi:FAD-dependent oxidoreductase [Jannaschia ovalis]|uniref:FAD-dependent oxidoreductase n=1 Tax=Jannaschia ovalis TaxID=3038773 RepID=A0ABY8L748_9RHOB|nr:FAD-dependent oxidoreductase [Jannaschia sp. GRR-S6-38]WGH77201.1 FAD-dependent oxidoreductase [Jannaschia sp. GRR-S6-38]